MFTNAGFKALAISPFTRTEFPETLTISNLQVSSPPASLNTLILNYAGLGTPFRVKRSVRIGSNSVLLTLHSKLQIDTDGLYLGGEVRQGEFSDVTTPDAYLGVDGAAAYNLTNGFFRADLLSIANNAPALFHHIGGTNQTSFVELHRGSEYRLRGGELSSDGVVVGGGPGAPAGPDAIFVHSDGIAVLDGLTVGSAGHFGYYTLSGGTLRAFSMNSGSGQGSFLQSGGTNVTSFISLGGGRPGTGNYTLSNGLLQTISVSLGGMSFGHFDQWGGRHFGQSFNLRGDTYYPSLGSYSLHSGLLCLSNITLNFAGVFFQEGGSNCVAERLFALSGGYYRLSAGSLSSFDITVSGGLDDVASGFLQEAGLNTVSNRLSIQGQLGFFRPTPTAYQLQGGAVVARHVEVKAAGEFVHTGGVITNIDTFTLDSGIFRSIGQTARLGQLIVAHTAFYGPDPDSRIELNGTACRLRFADSSSSPWPGTAKLLVLSWNGLADGGGADQLIFGTATRALTSQQLARIEFVDPSGFPPGRYPARILTNGEVTPSTRPTLGLAVTATNFYMNWAGSFVLQTATNVAGPFVDLPAALSPYTNLVNVPRRFFRLRK